MYSFYVEPILRKMTTLLCKTKDIKYTMTQYLYDSEFLKSVGLYHATHPNVIAGVVMTGKYRSPPAKVMKEDGKKTWKAAPIQDQIFTNILNTTGRTGNWIVTHGGPVASQPHMLPITSEAVWNVEEFEVFNSPLGLVALVTAVETEAN